MFPLTRNFTVIAFTGCIYRMEIFFTFPWKTEFALKFFAVLSILLHSGLLSNLRFCPEFTAFYIHFLSFRIFEQLALALKNTACPEFFHCIEYLFFYHSSILSNLCLPWKTEIPFKFFTVLKYFLPFRIFEQLALALKTEFALKIFKTGEAAAPPRPPVSYAYAADTLV